MLTWLQNYMVFSKEIFMPSETFLKDMLKLAPHRRDDGSHDEVLSIFYLYIKCVWDRGYINLLCHIKLNLSMFCKKCDSLYTSCLNTGLMMNGKRKISALFNKPSFDNIFRPSPEVHVTGESC